jgi:capsular polysaccharide export protein
LAANRVLLLQGPVGSFFTELSDWLTTKQIECFKVNFNAGDWRYYNSRPNIWHYRNKADDFDPGLSIKLINIKLMQLFVSEIVVFIINRLIKLPRS